MQCLEISVKLIVVSLNSVKCVLQHFMCGTFLNPFFLYIWEFQLLILTISSLGKTSGICTNTKSVSLGTLLLNRSSGHTPPPEIWKRPIHSPRFPFLCSNCMALWCSFRVYYIVWRRVALLGIFKLLECLPISGFPWACWYCPLVRESVLIPRLSTQHTRVCY